MIEDKIYYVGKTREHKSLTELFLMLSEDETPKTIYVDAGVYDIFREYKEANIPYFRRLDFIEFAFSHWYNHTFT